MPECECNHGCTACIGKITQHMNIIIYLVAHQWEQWKRAYLRRSPRKGERMLLRYHDQDVPCRVVKVNYSFASTGDSPLPRSFSLHAYLIFPPFKLRC
jgi:hypothetical protein